MTLHFKQVAIVGVGLIGGSLGMVLKRDADADCIIGVGRRVGNLRTAVQMGAIDRYVEDPVDAVAGADLVVLATPVDSYAHHLKAWADRLQPEAIVTDVGSVKGPLVAQAEAFMPEGAHFVGAHPIAGREKTGVAAGSVDLFRQARCILTPTVRTNPQALERVRTMWEVAGSVVSTMDPFVHDHVLGAVSHLPHVAAYALINALLDVQTRSASAVDLLSFSGGGLRDTTRIAASSPEMWRDIFLWNRQKLCEFIDVYVQQLQQLKRCIETGDGSAIEKELERAKQARERLN
jgi:prephenate dehydrogenase